MTTDPLSVRLQMFTVRITPADTSMLWHDRVIGGDLISAGANDGRIPEIAARNRRTDKVFSISLQLAKNLAIWSGLWTTTGRPDNQAAGRHMDGLGFYL